jgi:serine phosphatase RsbU (regulator of sigma subunit)
MDVGSMPRTTCTPDDQLTSPRTGPLALSNNLHARMKAAELALARLAAERDRLEAVLLRLGDLVAQGDAEDVARGVTEAARDLTAAPLAMFVPAELPAFSEPVLACEPGALREAPEPAKVPLLAGALWRVTPMRVDDAARWDADQLSYGRLRDGRCFRSWIGAPVRARHGNALGVLFLAHHRPHAFTKREEDLAQGLAAHLGASLDNISLSQENARVAGALQQTLLPPVLPEVPGLDVAARYRPARAISDVGGDFYDMFELRPGVWGLVVGDVSGVGPEAAAVTGIARYAVRALAPQGSSPAQLLSQLNDTLVRLGLQERFCTALYAELRSGDDGTRMKIANGGHPYPLVMRSDGSIEELAVTGTLLGAVPELSLEEREVRLAPGDVMVAYTDGIVEARNPGGDFFGTGGLAKVLSGSAGSRAAPVALRIELAVLEHQAGGAPDDMAIVVLRAGGGRTGPETSSWGRHG